MAVSISQLEANKRVKLKQLRQNCTVVLLAADSELCTVSSCKIRQIDIKEKFEAGPGNHLKSQFPEMNYQVSYNNML